MNVQALIDAAPPGATVHLPAGTFAGGVTISKSLKLIGAGSSRTELTGGDSVVRIASPADAAPPSVTISDLTITGGVARGYFPDNSFEAFGGGLLVEPQLTESKSAEVGADVVLRRVVVSGNRAAPTQTSPSPSGAVCPGGDCPYALAAGGGIATFGNLTLDHAVVRDNRATGRISDAQGGGVWTAFGHLRVLSSTISGNRAEPTAHTIGRYAEGGGLFTAETDPSAPIPLTVRGSRVTGNSSKLVTDFPVYASPDSQNAISMNSNGGGLHIGTGYATTIDRTAISGNRIASIDPKGSPAAFDSAVLQAYDGTLAITRSAIDGNSAKVVAKNADIGGPSGTAIEIDGVATISDTSISRNTVESIGTGGSAQASNGLAVYAFDGSPGVATTKRVTITGNTATAKASSGQALILGVGVFNNSVLTLDDTTVTRNRGTATSADALAQGGGVWNGVYLSGPPVSLAVHRSLISGNSVVAKDGTAQGGGLFNGGGDGVSFSLDHTAVVHNAPDQVFDAATAATKQAKAVPSASAAEQAPMRSRVRSAVPRL